MVPWLGMASGGRRSIRTGVVAGACALLALSHLCCRQTLCSGLAPGLLPAAPPSSKSLELLHTVLDQQKVEKLQRLGELLWEWNSKINVVSRKEPRVFDVHIVPCIAVALAAPGGRFEAGTKVLDVGCGGGLPGLVTAIVCPDAELCLVDSVRKKIRVVEGIASELELKNVRARWCRVEDLHEDFDFVTGRSVKALPTFLPWVMPRLSALSRKRSGGNRRGGVLYIKGGDLSEEIAELGQGPDWVKPISEILPAGLFPGGERDVLYFSPSTLRRISSGRQSRAVAR